MITDVHHVGIVVRDLDAASALFRDTLQLALIKDANVPVHGARVALFTVGGAYLEIIQPVTGTSPFAGYIDESGEGPHHLALRSDSVNTDVAKLRDLGVPLEDREPREGFTGQLSYLRPEAFGGAIIEIVQPEPALADRRASDGPISRIDHVVLRVPAVTECSHRFDTWLGIPTKRTMERGALAFAFMRPGDVIIEVIGPKDGGDPGTGRIAGLAFEVTDIDGLAATIKAAGYPIGEPHPALQGGRIVSIHHSGACGVPIAFINFTDSPGPAHRRQP